MRIENRGVDILLDAESQMRKLISEAAEIGDYASLEQLIRWASLLKDTASKGESGEVQSLKSKETQGRSAPSTKTKQKTRSSKGKRKRTSAYPKFERSGDTLLKIAWSKSTKSEYIHKAPSSVLLRLCESLTEKSKDVSVISMDSVLPLVTNDGDEIPDYQSYLCLAWLKSTRLISPKGREGYVVDSPESLIASMKAKWEGMPIHS